MTDMCEQCGREFEKIATHWAQSSTCEHPSFTQHQREIIIGLIMGDGSIGRSNKRNAYIQSQMISPNYLRYIDEQMGIFGHGVTLFRTAEESAKQCRERDFSHDVKVKNYSDSYSWRSMRHPELEKFADWYSSGKKVWPDDIELTPTVLKHWYCGDGNWRNSGTNNNIRIAMLNEVDNTKKVDRYFENVGLPSPSNYNTGENKCSAQFTVEQSHELWEYMGEPLPDFEYKWPEQYR